MDTVPETKHLTLFLLTVSTDVLLTDELFLHKCRKYQQTVTIYHQTPFNSHYFLQVDFLFSRLQS